MFSVKFESNFYVYNVDIFFKFRLFKSYIFSGAVERPQAGPRSGSSAVERGRRAENTEFFWTGLRSSTEDSVLYHFYEI